MLQNKWLLISFIAMIAAASLLLPSQAYYLNSSKPITKGSNGFTPVYVLTFKHESLIAYLKTEASEKGLYLMDLSFIERNTDVLKLLIEKNYAIGLITESTIKEEFNEIVFNEEIAQFQQATSSSPLWATAANEKFNEPLLQAAHQASINVIAANAYFNSSLSLKSLPTGSFLFINANQHFDFFAKSHIELAHSAQARTIEENLFNIRSTIESFP